MRTLTISDKLYEDLKVIADPFEDTPESVIRRLLDFYLSNKNAPLPLFTGLSPDYEERRRLRRKHRPSKHEVISTKELESALLQVLATAGGELPRQSVIHEMDSLLGDKLNENDRAMVSQDRVHWVLRVSQIRDDLIRRGILEQGAKRGVWRLVRG